MDKDIRILIAEDHNLIRKGYINILQKFNNFYVIGDVENGRQLIDKYFELKPDIVITDISMPVLGGLDAIREIVKEDPFVKAIILSMYTNEEYIYEALKIGIRGFLSKSILPAELRRVIIKINEGGRQYLNFRHFELEALKQKYEKSYENQNDISVQITSREKEVLILIAKNYSSQEIAARLKVSIRTVDSHRRKIVKKFNINNRIELKNLALKFASQNEL